MRDIEAAMSAPGFYDNRDQAQPVINRHQALMWELGDLMHKWEDLQKSKFKNLKSKLESGMLQISDSTPDSSF